MWASRRGAGDSLVWRERLGEQRCARWGGRDHSSCFGVVPTTGCGTFVGKPIERESMCESEFGVLDSFRRTRTARTCCLSHPSNYKNKRARICRIRTNERGSVEQEQTSEDLSNKNKRARSCRTRTNERGSVRVIIIHSHTFPRRNRRFSRRRAEQCRASTASFERSRSTASLSGASIRDVG